MLPALGALLACQLIGEIIARSLKLPVPGPVLGLIFLVAGLLLGEQLGRVNAQTIDETGIGKVTQGLLGVLGILFVPAGVGVVQQLDLFAKHGIGLAIALIGSTVITLVVTVWSFIAVARWIGDRRGGAA